MTVLIPTYPKFKKLELSDKTDFVHLTSKLSQYVECSFLEMYAWNQRRNPTKISILNDNLVMQTDEFLEDKYIITFLGRNKLFDTTKQLIQDFGAISNIHAPIIKNIKTQLTEKGYKITTEDDKTDYLINTTCFVELHGQKFENFRRLIRKYDNAYPDSIVTPLDINRKSDFIEIKNIFTEWGRTSRSIKPFQLASGLDCLNIVSSSGSLFTEIEGIILKSNDKIVGFSLNEKCSKNTAIGHFLITDKQFKGGFEKLVYEVVKNYKEHNCKWLNIGYDLGIDSLRATKTKLFDKLYKKYSITKV